MEPNRLRDPRYLSWFKTSLSLMYLKEGLEHFVENRLNAFHQSILQQFQSSSCPGHVTQLHGKSRVDLYHRNAHRVLKCPACLRLFQLVIQHHNNRGFNKSRTNPYEWETSPVEMSRLFLPSVREGMDSVKDMDLLSILVLLGNCSTFNQFIGRMDLIDELKSIRNTVAHTGTFHIEDRNFQSYVQVMLTFLSSLYGLTGTEKADIKLAIERITEVTSAFDISMNPGQELKVLESKMNELQSDVLSLEKRLSVHDMKTGEALEEVMKRTEEIIKSISKLNQTNSSVEEYFKHSSKISDDVVSDVLKQELSKQTHSSVEEYFKQSSKISDDMVSDALKKEPSKQTSSSVEEYFKQCSKISDDMVSDALKKEPSKQSFYKPVWTQPPVPFYHEVVVQAVTRVEDDSDSKRCEGQQGNNTADTREPRARDDAMSEQTTREDSSIGTEGDHETDPVSSPADESEQQPTYRKRKLSEDEQAKEDKRRKGANVEQNRKEEDQRQHENANDFVTTEERDTAKMVSLSVSMPETPSRICIEMNKDHTNGNQAENDLTLHLNIQKGRYTESQKKEKKDDGREQPKYDLVQIPVKAEDGHGQNHARIKQTSEEPVASTSRLSEAEQALLTSVSTKHDEIEALDELNAPDFDGRLIEIKARRVEHIARRGEVLGEGSYGITYKCPFLVGDEVRQMAVKEICCKDQPDNRQSAINEKLAARLKHPHIVPLLAVAKDRKNDKYYFIMPCMGNGDLCKAIKKDQDLFFQKQPAKMSRQIRLRILFQLASVIEFLHKGVENFREPYVHADITSNNIVLDSMFNMKLLDFGLSKEDKGYKPGMTRKSSNQGWTDGYRPRDGTRRRSVGNDCYSYGVVVLEMLTGLPPVFAHDSYLMEEENILMKRKQRIEKIWGNNMCVPNKLIQLVKRCKDQTISAEEITCILKGLLKEEDISMLEKEPGNSKCASCMVNPKDTVVMSITRNEVVLYIETFHCNKKHQVDYNILKHSVKKCKVEVCVPCIRNSYLNPIKCPHCSKDVSSPIGTGWGAVLIAGNDTGNGKAASTFKKDIEKVRDAITSKRRLALGIRQDDVKVVCPTDPGTAESLLDNLKQAFDSFLQKEDIHTLLIYMSGHGSERGFVLGKKNETITEDSVAGYLQELIESERIKKLIICLDYCFPKQSVNRNLDHLPRAGLPVIKLVATKSDDFGYAVEQEGSVFTNLFVQCLSGYTARSPCIVKETAQQECSICNQLSRMCNDGFISVDTIVEYIGKHIDAQEKSSSNQTVIYSAKSISWQDTKIAFYTSEIPKFQFSLEEGHIELDGLPGTMNELMEKLHSLVKDHLGEDNVRSKHFKDIHAIAIEKGSGYKSTLHKELTTLGQIECAWNGRSKLHIVQRHILNLHQGKVGIFLDPHLEASSVKDVIECAIEDTGCVEKKPSASLVKIPLGGLTNLWEQIAILENGQPDCVEFLTDKILETIDKSDHLKGRAGNLVVTFPYENADSEAVERKFFTLHVEYT